MPFRRRDVASTTGGGGGLPLPLAAIRVHLSVPSISSSRQHANEGRCKRRPPSRECAIRAIVTDNTRENTIPASSAFLVCQVHVKARLRKSLPSPPPAPRPRPNRPTPQPSSLLPSFISSSVFCFLTFLHVRLLVLLPHLSLPLSLSLSFSLSLSRVLPFSLSRGADTSVTVTNDTDVPRGYNGFKSRSFHLIHGHSSRGSHLRAFPAPRHGHEFLDSYPTTCT